MDPAEIARLVWQAFAGDAPELLRRIEAAFSELSEPLSEDDPHLQRLRHELHTLKGSANAVGAAEVADACHAAEEAISSLTPGEGEGEPFPLELFGAHVEVLDATLRTAIEQGPADCGAAEPEPDPWEAEEEAWATAEPEVPDPVAAGEAPPSSRALVPLAATEGPRVAGERSPPRDLGLDSIRVQPERIDAVHSLVGEMSSERRQYAALTRRARGLRNEASNALRAWRAAAYRLHAIQRQLSGSQRAELRQVAGLMGSSLESLYQGAYGLSRGLAAHQTQTSVTATALADGVEELRLMPLAPFFEHLRPVVREAAREAECRARLRVHAPGAEVDRAVLLRLRDPLMHLVRNAVAHGIEPPAERLSVGKPEEGTIRAAAVVEGAEVVIRIADDGRGVDRDAVRARAGAAVGPETQLDEEALLELLTRPGFSTRLRADSLAGRGVGLDVVRSAVEALDGRLTLASIPGQGTTFTITAPVTASSGRTLVLRTGSHHFGVLVHNVERLVRFGSEQTRHLYGRPVLQVGEEMVALVSLGELLGLPGEDEGGGKTSALILRRGGERLAMAVDELVGEEPLLIRPLGPAFEDDERFLGAAIGSEGAVLPILQVAACFSLAAQSARRRLSAAGGPEPAVERGPATVLVVDDSLTIRVLQRNILEAAGYTVVTASDGAAGLAELAKLDDCSLVVADIEMPNLDGIAMCAAIRTSERPHLPVLMLSSLSEPADQERALEAGADAYIVKADLQQTHYLNLVGSLTGRGS